MTFGQGISTPRLLAHLRAEIVAECGDELTIQVLPDIPEATVTIKRNQLRAWCLRRLETRSTHRNKALHSSGAIQYANKYHKHIA